MLVRKAATAAVIALFAVGTFGAVTRDGTLPAAGDYRIIVGGTRGNASYKLTVSIR